MAVFRLQDNLHDIAQGHSFAVDTNVVIACFSSLKNHHSPKTKALLDQLAQEKDCSFYYFVATRLELYYYFLRQEMTVFLKKYEGQNRSKIPEFEQLLTDLCAAGNIKLFTDGNLKELRKSCIESKKGNGLEKWKEIVKKGTKRLPTILTGIAACNFVYATKENAIIPTDVPLDWTDVESLMQATAIGSNDAAIINMFRVSSLIDIISNDQDFAFVEQLGMLAGKNVYVTPKY